jgi:putative heme iron utilization protein
MIMRVAQQAPRSSVTYKQSLSRRRRRSSRSRSSIKTTNEAADIDSSPPTPNNEMQLKKNNNNINNNINNSTPPTSNVVLKQAKQAATTMTTTMSENNKVELELPRQSDYDSKNSSKNRAPTTKLLRTPMAGGVVTAGSRDKELPPLAIAARNLMEQADYADLSTTMNALHHRRAGYPFSSTVDFATDSTGHPIFCLSPLAIHTRNIASDPKCSLTVKMNGWGGLANARVTLFGDVYKLSKGEYSAAANEIFKNKYSTRKESTELEDLWGDYSFFRMNRLIDAYFVGGFGSLNWINLDEYKKAAPDEIVTPSHNRNVLDTLSQLNARYSEEFMKLIENGCDDLWIISIDKFGMEVRVRVSGGSSYITRVKFPDAVTSYQEACDACEKIIQKSKFLDS